MTDKPSFVDNAGRRFEFESEEHKASFLRQHDNGSSQAYLATKENKRPVLVQLPDEGANIEEAVREQRQQVRRTAALLKTVTDLTINRVAPGTGVSIEYISFERFAELQQEYQQAVDAGEGPASALRRVGFQPTSFYVDRLYFRSDGSQRTKPVRPLFEREVGIRPSGTIVCLVDKMPGDIGTVVEGEHTRYRDKAWVDEQEKAKALVSAVEAGPEEEET